MRFNALTPPPPPGHDDIFAFAADHGASVLINKPLAQGLLNGKYNPGQPPPFGPGDHRVRKAWFTPRRLASFMTASNRSGIGSVRPRPSLRRS